MDGVCLCSVEDIYMLINVNFALSHKVPFLFLNLSVNMKICTLLPNCVILFPFRHSFKFFVTYTPMILKGKKTIPLLLFSVMLLIGLPSLSQVVDVETHRTQADTLQRFAGGFGIGLEISKNTSKIINLKNSADLTYSTRQHEFLILGRNNFLRVEGSNVLNDGFIHLRSVLYRNRSIAPEFFLQAQYNLDWGLKRRGLAGSAVRIRFAQTEYFRAFASTGLMIENEIWQNDEKSLREERTLLKSTTSVNVRGRIAENLDFAAISYYQARPDRFFKPRFTSDWQLRFRMSENLRFVFQFVSTYDSDPPFSSSDFIYEINNMIEVRF
ncbi:MAG: DUF481 domain-containing protein [Balneolaceae bacterium]|nr:MAG: DUF481 domain-containing protein [Balneolaceae bacterium]